MPQNAQEIFTSWYTMGVTQMGGGNHTDWTSESVSQNKLPVTVKNQIFCPKESIYAGKSMSLITTFVTSAFISSRGYHPSSKANIKALFLVQ